MGAPQIVEPGCSLRTRPIQGANGASTVRGGRGRATIVLGEPGIGKSRLLAEFRQWTVAREGCTWAEGRCLSYGRNLPYHLLLDLVRNLLGVPSSGDAPRARVALETRLRELLDPEWQEVCLYLAHLLGLPSRRRRPDACEVSLLRRCRTTTSPRCDR